MKLVLVALLSVLVAMVTPGAAKPDIDARIAALERKIEALAVGEKGGGNVKQMTSESEKCVDKCSAAWRWSRSKKCCNYQVCRVLGEVCMCCAYDEVIDQATGQCRPI